MTEFNEFHIRVKIDNSPEPADGHNRISVRAQVYVDDNDPSHIPPSQGVTFKIQDGKEGQSNAVFVDTNGKETTGDTSATSGMTPWKYFTSNRAGQGNVVAYLTEDINVSGTGGFSFSAAPTPTPTPTPTPAPSPSAWTAALLISGGNGDCYWFSTTNPLAGGVISAIQPSLKSPYTTFTFEWVYGNAVKIRDFSSNYLCLVGNQLYGGYSGQSGPDLFIIEYVDEPSDIIRLKIGGTYVHGWFNGWDAGYALYVDDKYGPDNPLTHFRIVPQPVPK